jgi:hypothetical protein
MYRLANRRTGYVVVSKNKPFKPPAGFVVGVHINMLGIKALAKELKLLPYVVAKACEEAGVALVADIMDLSGDSAKVLLAQEKENKDQTNHE